MSYTYLVGGRVQFGQCEEQEIVLDHVEDGRNGDLERLGRLLDDLHVQLVAKATQREI